MEAENKVIESIPVFTPHIARMRVKDQDPNYHYRWLSMDRDRIEFVKELLGYEIVIQKNTETGKEGPRIVNGSILMRCPRELYERRAHIRRLRSRQMVESPRSKVKDTAQALGVEATDSTREYRAPMSSAMAEPPDKGERHEGTVTRRDVEKLLDRKE